MTANLAKRTRTPLAPQVWDADEAAAVAALLLAAPAAFRNGGYFSRDHMCEDRAPVAHGFTTEMQPALLRRVRTLVGLEAAPDAWADAGRASSSSSSSTRGGIGLR
jgi:hypothetical protein